MIPLKRLNIVQIQILVIQVTDYNTHINEIEKKIIDYDHAKYITTQEFYKLTSENFAVRLAQANLSSKNDAASFLKMADFDDKLKHFIKNVTLNKTKHVLVENELKKYRQLTRVALLVKVTLAMMDHKIS